MAEFFQTVMGRKFYEADVPALIRKLDRIAAALEQKAPEGANVEADERRAKADALAADLHRRFSEDKEIAHREMLVQGGQYAMREAIVRELERRNWPEAADLAGKVRTTLENRQAIWQTTGSKE
jgi:hypothetical protein